MTIEKALAVALYEAQWGDYRPEDWPANLTEEPEEWFDSPVKLAQAILATPQMQAIARQAAIGAAVERLDEQYGEVHLVHDKQGRWWQWDREGLMWTVAAIEEALRHE